jgi:D-tyrosyl-tRNA(Tyr) deacylase
MRAVIQLVSQASVTVDQQVVGAIGQGLVVLLGVSATDNEQDAKYLADKIRTLRIFPDQNALMNRSLEEIGGAMLVVSQFTLYSDCRKGRRPSFNQAAPPEQAKRLYHSFLEIIKAHGITCACGQFQAMMEVHLVNQGPVTIILDSVKPMAHMPPQKCTTDN